MKEIKNNKLIHGDKEIPIVIQYWLPKWLNSAEAWILFNGRADINDIFSIIYERASKWIIKINDENWNFNITKIKELLEDNKEYEKELFKELCENKKININNIRIQVLDYCVKKWRINDYRAVVWNKINGWLLIKYILLLLISPSIILFTSLIIFWIYAILYSLFMIIVYNQESLHIQFNWWWWILSALVMILPIFIVIKTTLKKISKLKISITNEWAKLKSQILWYKKYLKQVVSITKNDIEKEKILIQEWSMANTIALKTNKESEFFKKLKEQYINKKETSYALQLLKKTYNIKYKSIKECKMESASIKRIDWENMRLVSYILYNKNLFMNNNEIDIKKLFNHILSRVNSIDQAQNIYWYIMRERNKQLTNDN